MRRKCDRGRRAERKEEMMAKLDMEGKEGMTHLRK